MSLTAPTVREALPTDLPAVAELFDLYRQFYEQPADRALAQDFIAQRMQRRESVILVADAGADGLMGFENRGQVSQEKQPKPLIGNGFSSGRFAGGRADYCAQI